MQILDKLKKKEKIELTTVDSVLKILRASEKNSNPTNGKIALGDIGMFLFDFGVWFQILIQGQENGRELWKDSQTWLGNGVPDLWGRIKECLKEAVRALDSWKAGSTFDFGLHAHLTVRTFKTNLYLNIFKRKLFTQHTDSLLQINNSKRYSDCCCKNRWET